MAVAYSSDAALIQPLVQELKYTSDAALKRKKKKKKRKRKKKSPVITGISKVLWALDFLEKADDPSYLW